MNEAALSLAKEAAEAEAGRLRGELADARAAAAAEKAAAAALRAESGRLRGELAASHAATAAAEASLAELLAAVGAPFFPACPALPAEVWAEVLDAVGASR